LKERKWAVRKTLLKDVCILHRKGRKALEAEVLKAAISLEESIQRRKDHLSH
jgi:hypothetical protein